MRQSALFYILVLLFSGAYVSLSKFTHQTSRLTKDSFNGDSFVVTDTQHEVLSFEHNFPFTDKRMQANQAQFERLISKAIISELSKSANLTEASQKYPHDSPVYLTIISKFAHHLLIDDYGLSLYTFSYDLGLNSCGVHVLNLTTLHIEQKKGDFFNLQSVPSTKYKLIIERMIKESSKYTKSKEEQEIPLFITVHPLLTFIPAAVIEDKLENLRVDFPSANVRYCSECPNILSFDEYAYLSWLTINSGSTENVTFFQPKDEFVINIGILPKAIFTSYPINIVTESSENDKIVTHQYCIQKETKVDAFVQNAFYERSLEKFTSDFLFFSAREVVDKKGGYSEEVKINFPCYQKNYTEKVNTFLIVGTGNYEECKKQVNNFMQKNFIKSENSQSFDLPNFDLQWPLEGLKDTKVLTDAHIYIESDNLEDFYNVNSGSSTYKAFKLEQLENNIQEYCKKFLNGEEDPKHTNNISDGVHNCLHLIYENSLLYKMGIKKDKELRLRVTNNLVENLLKGVTIRNLGLFHSLEKEWFYSAQDRILETYLVKLKETQETDKMKAINMTLILVALLMLTFWVAFIVRYRIKESVPVEDVKRK